MARKPDSPSGRPIRRLALLNEGKWDPGIPATTKVDPGVFGHVMDRTPGMRFTDIRSDRARNEYEEPSTISVVRTDKKKIGLPGRALFVGTGHDIATYSEEVLKRFELPRPARRGIYWEDDATGGLLPWDPWEDDVIGGPLWRGPKPPPDLEDRIPFVGLPEPMASKFVEENIDRWPDCWEAPFASEYLDRWGQIGDELERVRARFEDAAHDRNVSSLSAVRRRSNREPLDFPDWAFDTGYDFGRLIGELTERWRLGLLHGVSLLHKHRQLAGAGGATFPATARRRAEAADWRREAVRLAREVSADRAKTAAKALSRAAVVTIVITRAGRKLSKSAATAGLDGQAGEIRRAALKRLAGLKPDTVSGVLGECEAEWLSSSQAETSDDRST